jgi:hypothetical protein
MRWAIGICIVGFVMLTGCHWVAGYESPPDITLDASIDGSRDMAVARDTSGTDRSAPDRSILDRSTRDQAIDRALDLPRDMPIDSAIPDRSVDVRPFCADGAPSTMKAVSGAALLALFEKRRMLCPRLDAGVVDAQPSSDATVDDATVDDATVDDATVDDATVDDATVDDATVDDATVDDAKVADAKVAPVPDAMVLGDPLVEQSKLALYDAWQVALRSTKADAEAVRVWAGCRDVALVVVNPNGCIENENPKYNQTNDWLDGGLLIRGARVDGQTLYLPPNLTDADISIVNVTWRGQFEDDFFGTPDTKVPAYLQPILDEMIRLILVEARK